MIEGSDSFLLFLIAYATLDPIVSQLGRPGGGWNKWRKSRGKHILWQKAPVWRTTKSWTPFNAINERQAITVYIRTISSLLLLYSGTFVYFKGTSFQNLLMFSSYFNKQTFYLHTSLNLKVWILSLLVLTSLTSSFSKQLSVTEIQIFKFREVKCSSVWRHEKKNLLTKPYLYMWQVAGLGKKSIINGP